MTYQEELEVAKSAAREAGRIMEEYQRDGYETDTKSNVVDLVTEADVECQEAIVGVIRDQFPEDGLLGEEGLSEGGRDRYWVIDPIDGTVNYAHNVPYCCTSIALKKDGDTVVGVVYNPAANELFSATAGAGAYQNDSPIHVSDVSALEVSLIYVEISEWYQDAQAAQLSMLEELLSVPSSFRRPGAAALNLAHLAAGRGDGYLMTAINEWDVAAGSLILEEAGGTARIRDSKHGEDYLEMVASNGSIQNELEELFDRHVHRAQ